MTLLFSITSLLKAQSNTEWSLTGNPVDTTGWVITGVPPAIPIEDYVRLTTQIGHSWGAISYSVPINLSLCDEWSVYFEFRIYNTNFSPMKAPADGIAFWFLQTPPESNVTGGSIGIPNSTKGLSFVIDTYNNLNTSNTFDWRNFSQLEIYDLDGTDISNGSTFQQNALQVTSIPRMVELNGEFSSGKKYDEDTTVFHSAEFTYNSGFVTLSIDGTKYSEYFTDIAYDYGGYFGFSAATGGAWSNHDIRNVKVEVVRKEPVNFPDSTLLLCYGDAIKLPTYIELQDGTDQVTLTKINPSSGLEDTLVGPIMHDTIFSISEPGTYLMHIKTICRDYLQRYIVLQSKYDLIDLIHPDCYGYNNGSITAHVSSGVGNYSYSIDGGSSFQKSNVFSNLYAGSYTITTLDSIGGTICYRDTLINLIDPTRLIDTIYITPVSCNGGKDGQLRVTAQGGIPPYWFSINGGASFVGGKLGTNDYLFTNLSSGNYVVQVHDASAGCVATQNYQVTQPDSLLFEECYSDSVSCYGESTGGWKVRAVGGTPYAGDTPYLYTLSSPLFGSGFPISPEVVNAFPAGIYTITVKDSMGCSKDTTFLIEEPPLLVIDVKVDSVLCFGQHDGRLDVRVSGGNGGYTYDYSPNINASNLISGSDSLVSQLGPGTYFVTVTDRKGCSVSDTMHIFEAPILLIDTLIIDSVRCFGTSTGMVDVQVSGGVPPYNYSYTLNGITNPGLVDSLIDTLQVGDYIIYLSDSKGCETSKSFRIDEPLPLKIDSVQVDSVKCFGAADGSIRVFASGGTRPYQYQIIGDPFIHDPSDSSWTENCYAGTYQIQVIDFNACIDTLSIIVSQPDTVVIEGVETTSLKCYNDGDGSLTVTMNPVFGDYEYSIDSGLTWQSSPTFNGLIGGDYLVKSRTVNLCEDTMSVNIYRPALLRIDSVSIDSILCKGGNDGQIRIARVLGGTPPYQYSLGKDYDYQFSDTIKETRLSTGVLLDPGILAGVYNVHVIDANGCQDSMLVEVWEPATLMQVDSVQQKDVVCHGLSTGEVELFASLGTLPYQYSMDGVNFTFNKLFSGLSAGDYLFYVKDARACIQTTSVTLSEPALLEIGSFSIDSVLCKGESTGRIVVHGIGGTAPYVYSMDGITWQLDSTFLVPAGSYTISMNDLNNCGPVTKVASVYEPALSLGIDRFSTTPVQCYQTATGSVVAHVSGGTSPYLFSIDGVNFQSDSLFSNLSAGTYDIHVKDRRDCKISGTVSLTEPSLLVIDQVVLDSIYCYNQHNGGLDIQVSGGTYPYSYWLNGVALLDSLPRGLDTGTYQIEVSDFYSCDRLSEFVYISQPDSLIIDSVVISDSVSCYGLRDASLQIYVSGSSYPYQYELNGVAISDSAPKGLGAGIYEIKVMGAHGCDSARTQVTISQPDTVVIEGVETTSLKCYNDGDGSLTVTMNPVLGDYEYSIDSGLTWQSSPTFNGLIGGDYLVMGRTVNLCEDTMSVNVYRPALLRIDSVSIDSVLCKGGNDGQIRIARVLGGTPPYQYSLGKDYDYQFSDTIKETRLSTGVLLDPGILAGVYNVHVIDANGCQDSMLVEVWEPATLMQIDSVQQKDVVCHGLSTGEVELFASLGTLPYQYSMDGVNFTSNKLFSGLSAGDYLFYVKDARACIQTTSVTLSEPALLEIGSFSIDSVLCKGESTGRIVVHGIGGTAPYVYSMDGITWQLDSTFLVPAGSYTISMNDLNNCGPVTKVASVYEPALSLGIDRFSTTPVQCYQTATGSVVAHVSGGTSPYLFSIDGVNFQSDSLFSNLSAGTYDIHVKDRRDCKISGTVSLTEPSLLVIDQVVLDSIYCYNQHNGGLDIQVSGGTYPYSYWLNGVALLDSLPRGLDTGTYQIEVSDFYSCDRLSEFVYISQPDSLIIDSVVISDSVSCYGLRDASLQIYVSGSSYPYQYELNGVAISDSAPKGLGAGIYEIKVMGAHGCDSARTQVTISQPDTVVIEGVETTSLKCYNDGDGSLTVTMNPVLGDYEYSIDSGLTWQSSPTFNGLIGGDYLVMGRTVNLCEDTMSVNVYRPALLRIDSVSIDSVLCKGGNDGQIRIARVLGGTPPYQYSLGKDYDYQFSDTIKETRLSTGVLLDPGILAGVYNVHVIDANGCQDSMLVEVWEPATLMQIDSVQQKDVVCHGLSTGEVELFASLGTLPYQYSMDGVNFTSNKLFSGLSAGDYLFYVKDARACIQTTSVTLSEPALLEIGSFSIDSVLCKGESTGRIVVHGIGGTAPYVYSMDGITWQLDSTFLVPAGSYTISMNDLNNCGPVTKVASVYEPALSLGIDRFSTTPVQCYQTATGSVVAHVSGGTSPYLFSIDGVNFQSDSLFSNLSAGTYDIHVKDRRDCKISGTVSLTEPSLLVIDQVVLDSIYCYNQHNGGLDIQVSGGTYPYSYWLNGVALLDSLPRGLDTGTYQIEVSDFYSCDRLSEFVYISQPDSLIIDSVVISDSVSCYGLRDASLQIYVSGSSYPYQYELNGVAISDSAPKGLGAGIYEIKVMGAHGCDSARTQVTISQPDSLVIASVLVDPVRCYGESNGAFHIHTIGGTLPYTYTYSYEGGPLVTYDESPTLRAGNYSIYVKDAHGCTDLINASITEPTQLNFKSIKTDSVSCYGEKDALLYIEVSGGTPGYTYWLDGRLVSDTVFGLGAGHYEIKVLDANGCSIFSSVDVYEPDELMSIVDLTPVSCYGEAEGALDIKVSGGTSPYLYRLNGLIIPDSIPTNLYAGDYEIIVSDSKGCTHTSNVNIPEPSVLIISKVNASATTCFGENNGSLTILASGGVRPYQYQLDSLGYGSDSTFNYLLAGTYALYVRDAHNCVDTKVALVIQPDVLQIDSLSVDSVLCNGSATGTIEVHTSGGVSPYSYSIDGIKYQADNKFVNLLEGVYDVYVKDANDCMVSINTKINSPNALQINEITIDSVSCMDRTDGSIVIHANGGTPPYLFSIDGGVSVSSDSVFSTLGVGDYSIVLSDAKGCTVFTQVYIPNLSADLKINDDVLFDCATREYTVILWGEGGSGTYEYNFGNGWSSLNESGPLVAGTYTFYMRDIHCDLPIEIILDIPFDPTQVGLRLPDQVCMSQSNELTITNLWGEQTYWLYYHEDGEEKTIELYSSRGGQATLVTDVHDSSYVIVLDSLHSDSDSLCDNYILDKKFAVTVVDCSLKIFDVFTPNGDGYNDYFTIQNIENYPENLLQVYNRWGTLVYEKSGYKNDWDGKPNRNAINTNDRLPFGAYFCVLNIKGMKAIEKTIYIVK